MNSKSAPTLALVVARGGSKSIPHKNLAPLAGKPLIAWTIEAAAQCRTQLRIVLSTDDAEIAKVATRSGAEAPFLRPAALAEDATPTMPVVRHALEALAADGYTPERVLLLQPTSPLRTADDIDRAVALSDEHEGASVVSVSPARDHPDLLRRVSAEGLLADYQAQPSRATRRQDLEPVYALNGAIYLAPRESLLARDSFYAEKTYAYVMPPERSIDVDEPWDLHLCELILRDRLARD